MDLCLHFLLIAFVIVFLLAMHCHCVKKYIKKEGAAIQVAKPHAAIQHNSQHKLGQIHSLTTSLYMLDSKPTRK